jgi:succinoglycan biosynthesis protein ExoO
MPAFNAETFIHRAIDSVLKQTYTNWELIVIDDCSTDNTPQVVENFCSQDERVVYKKMAKNGGPGAARNSGFLAARGEWIAILDSDDRYEPDRIEFLLEQAKFHQADVVADNNYYYDESADKVIGVGFDLGQDFLQLTPLNYIKNCGTPLLFTLSLLKPMIRREYLNLSQVAYPEDLRIGEDFYFLFFLIWKGGKTIIFNKAKYLYTMPYGVSSKTMSTSSRTNHNLSGWDVTIASQRQVLEQVMKEKPDDQKLIGAIRQLEVQYLREKAWRKMKSHLANKSLIRALQIVLRINMVPYIWGKLLCKIATSQPIKK